MIHNSLCTGAKLPVRLLVAMPDDSHFGSFQTTIGGVDWKVFRTDSIAEGLSTLINHEINTIVTSCELKDGCWLELVEALKACRNAPRVLVASMQGDDRMWLDVLEHGGYDVLAMPFERSEILRCVPMAYLSWERKIRGLNSAWFPTDTEKIPRNAEPRHSVARAAGER